MSKIILVLLLALSISWPSLAKSAERIPLEVWTFGARLELIWKNLAPEYEKKNPNVKITVIRLPSKPMMDKLRVAFETGTGAPDIADVEPCGLFLEGPVEKVPLLDLTPYVEKVKLREKCIPGVWEQGMKEGRFFYAPWDVTATVLAYRRDIFKEEGLPSEPEEVQAYLKTWDDYIRTGKKLTKDLNGDGKIDRYMLAVDAKSSWCMREYQVYFTQAGGSWFDKDGEQMLDSKVAIDALQFYVDLINKHKIAMDIGEDVKSGVRFTAMNKGDVATVLSWGWYVTWIKEHTKELKGKWGAVLIPTIYPGGRRSAGWPGPGVACITKQTKHPDIAWDFMNFVMYEPTNVIRRYKEGWFFSLPPLPGALKDPVYSEFDPFWNQRIGKVMIDSLVDMPVQYHSPYLAAAWEFAATAIYEAVYGGKTPEQAMKDAAAKLKKVMKK